jgi:hypothetical protein
MARFFYPRRRNERFTYKRKCDESGFDGLRSEMVKLYDGRVVLKRYFEPPPRNWRRPFKRD